VKIRRRSAAAFLMRRTAPRRIISRRLAQIDQKSSLRNRLVMGRVGEVTGLLKAGKADQLVHIAKRPRGRELGGSGPRRAVDGCAGLARSPFREGSLVRRSFFSRSTPARPPSSCPTGYFIPYTEDRVSTSCRAPPLCSERPWINRPSGLFPPNAVLGHPRRHTRCRSTPNRCP
jgi:hypothetical protein